MEYRVSGIGRAPVRLVRAQALVAMCACATLAFTCAGGDEASLELTAFENPVPMAATAVVTGRVYSPLTTRIELTVNDTVIPIEADSTFRAEIALAPGALFHPVVAELRSPLGLMDRDRTVLITGDSIADGQPSPRSAALRINSAGLERIAPGMASLLDFDLAALLPHKKKISNRCLVDTFVFGCAGRAKVKVDNPPPKVSGWRDRKSVV